MPGATLAPAPGTACAISPGMNAIEAKQYGRRVKRSARALVEMGDAGTVVLSVDWQLADKSHRLGIVDSRGMVDMTGEVARAFRAGFGK